MKIRLVLTLALAALIGSASSLSLTSSSFSIASLDRADNPCAGNPCAGNPCAGDSSFQRKSERQNLILYQSETYFCDTESYEAPTVVFRSDLGNLPIFQFREETSPEWYKNNSDYTPVSRCDEIAFRAIEFHEMNLVSHLRVEPFQNTQSLCISNLDWPHEELAAKDPNAARLVFTFIKPVDRTEIPEILSKIKGRTRLIKELDPIQI